jgi:LysR family hca operon transcriptional activator
MELRHLRYFLAVAEEGGFTLAAERLHTAQPSLSRQIRDLEREVGTALLIRGARGVELTAPGKRRLKPRGARHSRSSRRSRSGF